MVKIKTSNLNLHFGQNHVLKNVNLEIEEKKITAIIGPSGCGKSTLLRTFNRMNDFKDDMKISGSIMVGDQDIYLDKIDLSHLRAKVGMVFQKPNPFPKSIYKNVSYGLDIQGKFSKSEIQAKVEESLCAAWLWEEVKDRLHSPAMSLSGGQQQRLCIARALANSPEVLLLDEPTSALDPQSTARIEELCVALKQRVSILIVTHNIAQAGRISDYTAFMYLGEVVEYADTSQMFTVPKDKRTEAYLNGVFG
ncbi:MAG: phosphate ABC transporter ATP-binding protein PstB [Candidatus Cloacimonetes bacterium]|jgi:phosphate transport system ATP-binding protein|nr:phosphate ABC transporter ATP-binding protein PstB [Candidatus Cloacimonadota bacterium]MDY0336585.1 phosphate ABC transporter ATP-binding protein PstB [Candidatus Cloacimonadaceae bacterium]MCK9334264.1 phosphate ABC transporter ATP-binding protein PstB [Candidatus Cloacimonadota bacterium]MDD2543170.1 phosphate ABC transporter ATP-binding protein PstB [Candidatus Cloacimonadota bacterium]MDD2682814.1 phosphate ABC transporter ATP-binding protein PstB [Candidatus Cloacimonadota bacterium]